MKLFVILFLAGILTACGNSKDAVLEADVQDPPDTTTVQTSGGRPDSDALLTGTVNDHNISIAIQHHSPYCGGMAPSPEIIASQTQPQRNSSYILIMLDSGRKTRVKTDSSGTLYLQLPPGKYAVREMYKDCTFDEFKAQNFREPTKYFQENGGEACYKKWWEQNLGEFEILAGDPIQHFNYGTSDRCFTGNNPCIMYSGPLPP